jgi:hypothetical protein
MQVRAPLCTLVCQVRHLCLPSLSPSGVALTDKGSSRPQTPYGLQATARTRRSPHSRRSLSPESSSGSTANAFAVKLKA